MIRPLFFVLVVLLLFGCGDQPDTAALKMAQPTAEDAPESEPEPLEAAKQRLAMNATKVGDLIVKGIQVGALEPGGEAAFELSLFNSSEWPGKPQAWVGEEKMDKAAVRHGEEMAGAEYHFLLPLPSPIASSSRLWVRVPSPDGQAMSGAFKLQR